MGSSTLFSPIDSFAFKEDLIGHLRFLWIDLPGLEQICDKAPRHLGSVEKLNLDMRRRPYGVSNSNWHGVQDKHWQCLEYFPTMQVLRLLDCDMQLGLGSLGRNLPPTTKTLSLEFPGGGTVDNAKSVIVGLEHSSLETVVIVGSLARNLKPAGFTSPCGEIKVQH